MHLSFFTSLVAHSSSVRAFRASVQNEMYVRDVIEQREKRKREEEERIRREKELAKINPFSVRVGSSASSGRLPTIPLADQQRRRTVGRYRS